MKAVKAIFFLIILTLTGCAAELHQSVPLVWKPTNDLYAVSTANLSPLYSKKIQIARFADKRTSGNEIGKYIEDGANMPVTTSEDIAAWSTERFTYIFNQYGINSVQDNPDVILTADVMHLYVTEDKTYKGNAGLKVTARSRSGEILWEGMTTGSAKRFGRTYKLENYYEVLCDAYSEAVINLLRNGTFVQALK